MATDRADDLWATLAAPFADDAYATVKGFVRTYVVHQHLMRHLPASAASVLDIGGGAGHQSLPLARLGLDVTLLDSSAAMLAKAQARIDAEPPEVAERLTVIDGDGHDAVALTGGATYDVVLCHGVVMYLDDPEPLLAELVRCVAPGGLLSILALNAATMAVRPALEHRWADALAAFDATTEVGVLGVPTRADTVAGLSAMLSRHGAEQVAWYGGWLFSDWLDLSLADADLDGIARVELVASQRDPYRSLSRVFHLLASRRSEPGSLTHSEAHAPDPPSLAR